MRVLVTGGAGYIGSHTARKLAAAGHEVVIFDNLLYGHRSAAGKIPLVVEDLIDRDKLTATLLENKIEAVIHFAAFAQVGESVTNPSIYYNNNICGTISLLDAMRAADVGRIVFSSTCATYGIPASSPIDETFPQAPINPYGFSKLAIEHALQDYSQAYGIAYAALRYFNAAGASPQGDIGEDHTPESHLIPVVLQVALGQRKAISIFGTDYPTEDGTCVRDYIHVDDLADAHLLAMEKITPENSLQLNLGTGRGSSVQEIVEACREVTGHEIPTELSPRRAGDPPALVANPSLARKILDWQPKYLDVRETIETAWRWHQSHPQGFAD
ncbi:UDP-glucose 4-epimerase GalE [Bremerella cremea]|uniref:UDP-glucose 4-epimerase n=1 Tax=Bremerella cremea TaxID=1031537 RepID=A0A368KKW7_9BACT|nr:UDP-glucose 4-epimerase GalE [Bremerella cremea]RCS41399.1 UDP-glucose 4-epimerase GalE [Bremerella cremea]